MDILVMGTETHDSMTMLFIELSIFVDFGVTVLLIYSVDCYD